MARHLPLRLNRPVPVITARNCYIARRFFHIVTSSIDTQRKDTLRLSSSRNRHLHDTHHQPFFRIYTYGTFSLLFTTISVSSGTSLFGLFTMHTSWIFIYIARLFRIYIHTYIRLSGSSRYTMVLSTRRVPALHDLYTQLIPTHSPRLIRHGASRLCMIIYTHTQLSTHSGSCDTHIRVLSTLPFSRTRHKAFQAFRIFDSCFCFFSVVGYEHPAFLSALPVQATVGGSLEQEDVSSWPFFARRFLTFGYSMLASDKYGGRLSSELNVSPSLCMNDSMASV